MTIGLLISVGVHAALLSTYYLGAALQGQEASFVGRPIIIDIEKFRLPPIGKPSDPPVKVRVPVLAPPLASVPKPVDHEIAADAPAMPTQSILKTIADVPADTTLLGDLESGRILAQDIPDEGAIPEPGIFISRSQEPSLMRLVQPQYPEIAMKAALEGSVKVQFFVDKNGNVAEVRVVQAKPADLGFEEEAVKAVQQWKFVPALQGDHPVGVWVGWTIKFKVDK